VRFFLDKNDSPLIYKQTNQKFLFLFSSIKG
jgi:uncharacterized membrane protein